MARRPTSQRKKKATKLPGPGSGIRPVWTGQLRLSLVSVPVRVYTAIESGARLNFHMVHEPSGKRVRYEKVVPGIGPIDSEDIIKGYEVNKGEYVLLDDEDIEKARIETRHTCELVQFVEHCEIDPIYFDKPYYLMPDDELAEEPYQVLRDALRESKKMALGQIVMRRREYIVAIKPCGAGLMLETLRYADEVREAAPYFADIDENKPEKELLDLAKELIERKAAPFDAEKFRDRYSDALREIIEAKAKRKTIEVPETEAGPRRGENVIDLVDALRRSVGRQKESDKESKQTKGGGKSKRSTTRRKAG